MPQLKIKAYQIRHLKKIGFRDSELVYFTPPEADRVIASFYQKGKNQRNSIKQILRKA